jgi:RNA polymerase sigma-70 factor (ECF subfamily)
MLIEEQLFIQSLKSGDSLAYERLVKLYQNKVYNTCYSFLKQSDIAEDQTQEVFILIFNSIAQFEEKSSLSTWIYRIAVSRCLDYLRSQNRQKRKSKGLFSLFGLAQEIPASNDLTPYEHLENKEYAKIIANTLDEMKDKYKTAFVLKYMEGLSQKEIAQIMECSEKAVEGILARAKIILKEKLISYFPEMRENKKKNI